MKRKTSEAFVNSSCVITVSRPREIVHDSKAHQRIGMAHGLTCNEASVCNQCISFGQPCIHRWCRYSQSSIDNCERGKCHYAHMDSVPHEEGEAKWMILKGDLPAHLSRGRLAPRSVERVEGDVAQKELMDMLNARQMDAIRMFHEAATTDRDVYAKNSVQCGCNVVGSEV